MEQDGTSRIVVGVDGSAMSDLALAWALQEARLWDATVDVVYAWSLPMVVSPVGVPTFVWDREPYELAARDIPERALARVGGALLEGIQIRQHAIEGRPARVLLDSAGGASLLVVGSRGRGGFTSLLLGSVSQQCLQHASCPVAVVPQSFFAATSGRVVVGVDGSEGSFAALRFAVAEAARRRAKLIVVHAWEAQYPVAPYGFVVAAHELESYATGAQTLLEDMTSRVLGTEGAEGAGGPAGVELVPVEQLPAAALVAAGRDADLLVVGSRGRGGFAGLLLGSVSQQVAQHAPCPVVVTPHPR